ncbi:XVIPCD domain-containing protein [Xanthomonas campestris]|uniref:XVIPCD domain-containing protein n=1 Tax=Xanthomonas campestris TaxID=339 RepID=UPI002B22C198|nr:XVIPCD domain-containing protein [Xanthomonas campestris]MEA9559111.1 XVIPCD domain-containing protein [Xanthomonas campestris]MEA9723683.1 XVIPCD domain-containing protein [Xanthomonas campestris]MEB1883967.1 XVIPCD domain-containing protein [Xanthomonas campestris pv. campestris]
MPGKPLFQPHHAIEQQAFKSDPLLQVLVDSGRFSKDAATNLINLPNDKALAHAIGVTPHTGRPIKEYGLGLKDALEDLAATKDGQAALRADPDALDRVALKVQRLSDTAQVALINGDLRTNIALGQTMDQTRAVTQAFFGDPNGYAAQNATQLDAYGQASANARQWSGVTQNEGRIVSTLQHFQSSGQPLLGGGDLDLQRHGLSQAISSAYHDGRLTMSPGGVAVVENTLGEEAARNLRVPRGQRGEVAMQLLMGEASARGLTRAGGLLATGADAVMTARTASALMEQGNTTAAQSEVQHAIARNAGGWAGGAATAAALGSSSGFVPSALVVGDAVLMSKAFDKAVDLKENRDIFHQTDKAGVEWQFNGRDWERQGTFDRAPDGRDAPTQAPVGASYVKSQELGAMANAKAAEFALGKAPPPQDPFNLPAKPGDQTGLDNQNWQRNPTTESWERQVKTSVAGANDQGVYEPQTATPAQAQRLNQESLARIENNISTGREAIAQAYLESHAAQRGQDYGVAVPEAVESARAKQDRVQGHDGQLYQRNDVGQWAGRDGVASGNLAVELELTNQMRQPSLERAQEALSAIEARPAPTPVKMEHNELLHRYRAAGVDLNAQENNLQAVELATQRTKQAEGLTGPTMQQLKPNEQGQYGYDSPIAHYQTGPNGVAHQVAVTTADELRQAKAELSQPAMAHVPTLGAVSVTGPGRSKEQEAEPAQETAAPGPVLADNPAHPDHSTYQQIHSWVRGTGNWNVEESKNVTASLYKQQTEDPLLQRVDKVTGGLGKDGAENVFAVYAPFGDKGPFFHAHVDGREASQEPAQQNLQQAEVIKQDQVRQQAQEQTQQQTAQQEQGPRITM